MAVRAWLRQTEMIYWLPPVLLGGMLRFWGLSFGLPSFLRPDEDLVILPSLAMIGGDLDPYDYTYPTLYKYLLALIFRICMALGLGAGPVVSAWQYAAYGFFVDPSFFFWIARCVTAGMGTAMIYAVYRIGREGYGRAAGVLGAVFLGVSVLHVRDAHFGVTDMSSVALLMFSVMFSVRIAQEGRFRDYAWAGVLVGLAASTKYGSALGVVPLGVAHLCRQTEGARSVSHRLRDRRLWGALGLSVLAFGITSPYMVLNTEAFLKAFGLQLRHVFQYGHGEDLGVGWLYHVRISLRYGLGGVVLLFALGGIVLAGIRRKPADGVLLSLFLVYYAVTGQGRAVFFRYALPLAPLCCVFGGVFVAWICRRFVPARFCMGAGVLLGVLGAVEPLGSSVRFDRMLSRKDTRVLARDWVEKTLPEGQMIANVGGVYGDVPLKNRQGMGWWLFRFYRAFPHTPERALADYLSGYEDDLPPPYLYTNHVGMAHLEQHARGLPADLEDPEVAYVITHTHPLVYSDLNPEYQAQLEKMAVLVQEFRPGPQGDLDGAIFDRQDAFYFPVARFGRLERGGPVVRIWRIQGREGGVFQDARNQRLLITDTFVSLGNVRFLEDKFDFAASFYKQALKLDSGKAPARMFLGMTHLVSGRYREAAAEVKRALEGGMDIGAAERILFARRKGRGDLYAKLGNLCALLKHYPEAVKVYERAISLGYQDVGVYNNLGAIYYGLQENEKAREHFLKALALDPNDADARLNLERVNEKLGIRP